MICGSLRHHFLLSVTQDSSIQQQAWSIAWIPILHRYRVTAKASSTETWWVECSEEMLIPFPESSMLLDASLSPLWQRQLSACRTLGQRNLEKKKKKKQKAGERNWLLTFICASLDRKVSKQSPGAGAFWWTKLPAQKLHVSQVNKTHRETERGGKKVMEMDTDWWLLLQTSGHIAIWQHLLYYLISPKQRSIKCGKCVVLGLIWHSRKQIQVQTDQDFFNEGKIKAAYNETFYGRHKKIVF